MLYRWTEWKFKILKEFKLKLLDLLKASSKLLTALAGNKLKYKSVTMTYTEIFLVHRA